MRIGVTKTLQASWRNGLLYHSNVEYSIFFTIGIHVPHTHTAIFCTAIASATVVVASMINLIAGPLNVILYICVLCAFLTVYIYKSRIIKVTHAPPSHHQTILRLKAMRLPQSPTAKRAFDVMSLSLWQQCSREK